MEGVTARRSGFLPAVVVVSARYVYATLASMFAIGVVVQVFLAGVGVFAADWNLHTTFVHFMELILPVVFVVGFFGRMSWRLKLAPVLLWVLVTAQYAFAYAGGPVVVSALHTVNALVIFSVATLVARSAIRLALQKRRNI